MLRTEISITDQDARTISVTKGGEYHGQVAHTQDGRTFVYSSAGATNLAAGLVTTGTSTTSNHVNQTGTANPVGTTSITFTIGGTAATANQYTGGQFVVNDGPGVCSYRIRSNTASAGSAAITVVLENDEPLTVATTTSSKFSLYPSLYNATIVGPGNAATVVVNGVPNVAVTAAYFYWSQTSGDASVLSDGAITKNAGAIVSASVAGALTIEATTSVTQRVGFAPEATVDAKYYPVTLTIQQ